MSSPEAIDAAGEPMGTGWRTASWMAFGIAALIAFLVLTTKAGNMVEGFVLALAALIVPAVAALGAAFAIFGAVASSRVGDRRVIVILPLVANAGLILWFLATIFAP